jgi:hypothetical protein
MTANETNSQKVLFLFDSRCSHLICIDLLANEEKQSHLTGVVRDETEFEFKMFADEWRRSQTEVRRVAHERAVELRAGHVHRCENN